MAIYRCDGVTLQAKYVNDLPSIKEGKPVEEIKTIWRGKLSELVDALVEEFLSIENYSRIARSWLNAPVYDANLLEEGMQLTKGIKISLARIEELLEALNVVSQKYNGGEFPIDDREV